jgi:hypothetical protein
MSMKNALAAAVLFFSSGTVIAGPSGYGAVKVVPLASDGF